MIPQTSIKHHITAALSAGNVFLHILLGIGIASLFLIYERSFILQLMICVLMSFAVGFFGEYLQKIIFKAAANFYDAVNTGIGGLFIFIVYILIYGIKLDSDIEHNHKPRMFWFWLGLACIGVSTLIWIGKNFMFKKKD
jgi:hypothetical protein